MWRRAEAMRRVLPALCSLLLLAGCVTAPVSHEPLSVPAQQDFLRGLGSFQFNGRAAVQVGDESVTPSVSWRQKAAESQLKLAGPVFTGSMMLFYSPQSLRVTTSRGEKLQDAEAEQALSAQLGFLPPFDALRYWVLGIAAPGEPATGQVTDVGGRITELTQREWRIQYDRWTEVATPSGVVSLPQRLTATRANLRLKLFVERWKLQSSD
jgi:outer membrane lipoprotein LolB